MVTVFDRDNSSLQTKPPSIIPIIDFSPFLVSVEGSGNAHQAETAAQLINAFSASGFVYLVNHGVPQEDSDTMFRLSKEFFAQDITQKELIAFEHPEFNRGYVGMGEEKLTDLDKEGRLEDIKILNELSPDLKEAWGMGAFHGDYAKNRYPSPAFGEQCEAFYDRLHALFITMMQAIAIGLDLDKDFFHPFISRGDGSALRMLHYPSCDPSEINETSRRCGAHTDYGCLTFLFQDLVGGLEVHDRHSSTDAFVQAVPVPGAIVVNVGDLLQRWTNDYLQSTQHRVVKPYSVGIDGKLPARYSVVYFCEANSDALIETIPKFVTQENPQKYEAVTAADYLFARLNNTHV